MPEKEVVASAVLNPLPLNPFAADAHVTPEPLDQFEKVTPVGGVAHVAVGRKAQVPEAPPPTTTFVCPHDKALINSVKKSILNFNFLIGYNP